MGKLHRTLTSGTASALLLLAAATGHAQDTLYGLGGMGATPTSLSLFSFRSNAPGAITNVGAISGVATGFSLVAIDFRPATGQLYGLAYNGTSSAQLYTLNLATAAATPVGATAFTIGGADGGFGNSLGIGFNPAVDLVRVVTGTNGNFRVNPTTGAIVTTGGVDGGLAYQAGDVNANSSYQIADGDYTTDARLFDIDYVNNVLARQNPPNAGTLATIGNLGVTQINGAGSVGFDINGVNAGYLSTAIDTDPVNSVQAHLLNVNLANGSTTDGGLIGAGANFNTVDIAVQVPEPGPCVLFAVGLGALALGVRRQRRAA